jgi:FtsZ-interacting cell division protein YlmF
MAKLLDSFMGFLEGGMDEDEYEVDSRWEEQYDDEEEPRRSRASRSHHGGAEYWEPEPRSRHSSSRGPRSGFQTEFDPSYEDDLHLPPSAARRRSKKGNNVYDFESKREISGLSEIRILFPKEIEDATAVCEYLRENKACIINMQGTERAQAQRIADCLGGVIYSLNGNIKRIDSYMFVVSPNTTKITSQLEEEIRTGSVFGKTKTSK